MEKLRLWKNRSIESQRTKSVIDSNLPDFNSKFLKAVETKTITDDMRKGAFRRGIVTGLAISDKEFRDSYFARFRFKNCTLTNCTLLNEFTTDSVFEDCTFEDCTIAGSHAETTFHRCHFFGKTFEQHKVDVCRFIDCEFHECSFAKSYSLCDFSHSLVSKCVLLSTRFDECNFGGVRFDARVALGPATRFEKCISTDQFQMTRLQLSYLNESDCGGLSVGQRVDMQIRDDAGQLRSMFTGFQFWLHLIAILSFLTPYLVFVLTRLAEANIVQLLDFTVTRTASPPAPTTTISMASALSNYFVSGGRDWAAGKPVSYLAISTGALFLTYNIVRIMLWAKSSSLAKQETISGLPARFHLSDFSDGIRLNGGLWSALYHYHWLMFFLIGLVSAFLHACQFLLLPVPIWH